MPVHRHFNADGTVTITDRRTLEDARAESNGRVTSAFEDAVVVGIEYPASSGRTLQIRSEDRLNIASMALRASMSLGGQISFPPEGWLGWRMADNAYLEVATAQAMIALGDVANVGYLGLLGRLWAAKAAIGTAATNDAADAVSF